MKFKDFLINENSDILNQKVGDILSSLHDLDENGKSMGARHFIQSATNIVDQIRRILHVHWGKKDVKILASLQKIGVAIMRSIDEKEDLHQTIQSAKMALEELLGKTGMPVNNLMAPDYSKEQPEGMNPSQGN